LKNNKQILLSVLLVLLVLLVSAPAFSISPDEAVAIVSVKNNYLMPNESTSVVSGMITYNGTKYIVVAATKSDSITAYIPLKNTDGNIASMDLEIREIIKTAIVYTKMSTLKSTTTPANWPFSYSTKNFFYDLGTDFTSLMNDALSIQTILNAIGTSEAKALATKADDVQAKAEALAKTSKELSTQVDTAMKYETDFLTNPDTNKANKYETYYKTYFTSLALYKQTFTQINQAITELNQEISTLDPSKLTAEQQNSYQLLLTKAPIALSKASRPNPSKLDSFLGTTDQIRTLIEGVFNESKNSESFATTLASRKTRNEAWKMMYGTNDALLKINPSFETLEKAANAILSTDNIDSWADREAVDGLQANWSGAQSRYNNSEYEKAKNFATNAQKNVKQVIDGGTISTVDNSGQDLLIKIVIGLIIIVIGIFVFENFIMKKKKPEEEYNEP
jgi:hypothetical protein